MTKRVYIKTYGCQMNVYDSERMADVLRPLGYGMTDNPEDADLVVLNDGDPRRQAVEAWLERWRLTLLEDAYEADDEDATVRAAEAFLVW